MTVKFIDSINSTQDFLIKSVKEGSIIPPFALVAAMQTNGIGSRGNEWEGLEGNLFMSFCIANSALPDDVCENSLSIYFAGIMCEVLRNFGSQVWLKWPNDFYVNDMKIGGTITSKVGEIYICGLGLNLVKAPKNAGILDVNLDIKQVVSSFILYLEQKPSWKQIFTKFAIDFEKSRLFSTHKKNKTFSLADAKLLDDGSLLVGNERIFSLR
jgi:biotin--[acetyl-coA-carboxylase] ligase